MNNSVTPDDSDDRGGQNQDQPETLKADLTLHGTIVIQITSDSENKYTNSSPNQPFLNRFFVIASVFVGIALVVVGLLQFGVYSRQAKIMKTQTELIRNQDQLLRDANDLTRAIQRAFVYLEKMNYAFYDTASPNQRDLLITVEWGNSGNTPTEHLTHQVGCFFSDTGIADPFGSIPWTETNLVPDFFGPKTDNLAGTCGVLADTISRINTRQTHLYICDVARYGDMLDTEAKHVTEFCYEITRIHPSNAARNFGNSVGRHNCADKDCPQ